MTGRNQPRVLLVEDSPDLAWMYARYLAGEPIILEHVSTLAAARACLAAKPPAVMIVDLHLPDGDGLELLSEVAARGLACTVIVITAYGSIERAVAAMRAGAYDFLAKPFPAERLIITLRNALEHRRLSGLVTQYEQTFGRERLHDLIGASAPMQTVYRIIENVAPSTAPVFITGESGTGKELCAHAIHACGPRRKAPFVAINCAAVARDLMESEIFGHVRGAFTGAIAARTGAARLADGGTLFLDEVCDTDLAVQKKLLRFVQSGRFRPVGSDRTEKVDVRLICATNRDPWAEVEAGRFREDLYYRLYVVPLHMPPLRERGDDIIRLARAFLREFADEENKAFRTFDSRVEAAFLAYPWPGNVRELRNVVRTIVVLHDGTLVQPAMLPPALARYGDVPAAEGAAPSETPAAGGSGISDSITTLRPTPAAAPEPGDDQPVQSLHEIERAAIEAALARCGGNITRAAALLGISPSTIYRKRQAWQKNKRRTKTEPPRSK
ncbi:MAG: sigma-54-dependent Fis family transcriptional regulator [Alphaproteobacteria bacterium]|nr:MAG: sigma-54-dependent Fis family transcriptional regulator [Alphaproteobacteria bacterium]